MSTEIYDELIAAGAPELPDDFFFRIKEWMPEYGEGDYEVDLRRRGRRFSTSLSGPARPMVFNLEHWRKLIAEDAEVELNDVDDGWVFAVACSNVYKKYERAVEKHAAAKRARRYLGDHP